MADTRPLRITESDFIAASGDRELFRRLDRADGKADGVYRPREALKRAKKRVAEGGMDAYLGLQDEHRGLRDALAGAKRNGLAVQPAFAAAVELAEQAVAAGAAGLKLRLPAKTRAYRSSGLSTLQRYVTDPLLAILKDVQAGSIPHVRDNPDRAPVQRTRYETVDLKALYDRWIAVRDARSVPLQRQAQAVRNTNYAEYQRLNDEARQIMNQAEAEIFGSRGFSLRDFSYRSGDSNQRVVEVQDWETPPAKLYDERVPAANTILRKAEARADYRAELTWLLEDSARLAVFLEIPSWQRSTLGELRSELRQDIDVLMSSAGLSAVFAYQAAKDVNLRVLTQPPARRSGRRGASAP
ncbi:MAG: hypothetical protein IT384_28940 [Deltaproteobacteria bacterium]|nr:hypothetical protein [Deltaproteobacteria bacterium]